MLGQIANFATIISRNTIVKNATSLNDIWLKIREYYGFQHHCALVSEDEELSPSLENLIVFLWLERIHTGLPDIVKQRYGAELRSKTLASIRPEISQALSSLLDELKSTEEVNVMRSQISQSSNRTLPSRNTRCTYKYYCLCRTANHPGYDTHYLSQCEFLPQSDRKCMTVYQVETLPEESYSDDEERDFPPDNDYFFDEPVVSINRVSSRKSPHLSRFYQHYPALICIDTGAESNLKNSQNMWAFQSSQPFNQLYRPMVKY